MPQREPNDQLVQALIEALLGTDFLEVHGVLRAVGAERLPPGWRDFGPASKRRTLQKIVVGLTEDQLAELAEDFVQQPDGGLTSALGPLPEAPSSAWRPAYVAPETPAERYGLSMEASVEATVAASGSTTNAVDEAESPKSIFVVHGRDSAPESQTLLLIERATGRSAVVLHEQVTSGRTIIEQIEHHAAKANYAVVLLTGDDQGGLRGGDLKPRARQNVILELGYFWGQLGRDRVAVLVEEGVELPSDAGGIHYILIDAGGGWKAKLLRELVNAGFEIDWSRTRL